MSARLGAIALLMFVVSAASGCIGGRVKLSDRALETPLSGGRGRQVIIVTPFRDGREVTRCGMQKNVLNLDVGDVWCDGEPGPWLPALLANELRTSGFEVVGEADPHRPGALRIEGRIEKLFVEPLWLAAVEADLFVRLRVTSESGLVGDRGFLVKGWRNGPTGLNAPNNRALYRATQQALLEMVQAVIELMDKYPQLGDSSPITPELACLEEDAR